MIPPAEQGERKCVLGHTRRAYECPSCGEIATPGQTAKLEHWRWYRGRTSSKRIKDLIDVRLAAADEIARHVHDQQALAAAREAGT